MKRWLVLVLFALACSREHPVTATSSAAPIDDDTPQDGGTLIRRLDIDVPTVNPVLATSRFDRYVANYVFTPLVYFDINLEPMPGLAESWKLSDDGRIYTFKLNKKATFSDGTPVRASDVVFTLRKIVDPQSEAVQIAGGFEQLDLTKTRAVDDATVEVAFREPLASQLIRFNDVLVLPEHVYATGDFKNDFNDKAVGSGPYKLVRKEAGKEIVLQRRPDYWAKKPYLDTVIFKVVIDTNTAWNALKRWDIDETILQSDIWMREHTNRALASKVDFRRFYTLNYNYIAWNERDPLFADARVRRALTTCMPIDSIINDLYHGTARAMSGPFTPDEWAYNPEVPVIRYDPQAAKRMLASAGWLDSNNDGVLDKDGKPFRFDLLIMSGTSTTMQLAQTMQAELKNIGVAMEIVVLEGSVAIQRILGGQYSAAYLSWDLDPDPDPFGIFHSSQFPPRGQNFVFYRNPVTDALLERGRTELDPTKRKDLYHQAHAQIAQDQPYTWLFQVSSKWGVSKRVHGVNISRGYGLFLWYPGEFDWWIPRDQRVHDRAAH
ncbi:MAG TPA: ABC transporter substrate-binding protein [Thermoanaerobaculia bacterium]|nr:ABC transporter substrate-binding protein [Thermoanaerobaculia bacterium]